MGGPIVIPNVYSGRDRTFFFAAIEVSREPREAERERTVWTPDARNGIFKYVGANGNVEQVNLLQIAPNFKTINPITSDLLNQTPLPNSGNVGDGRNTQGYRFLSKAMNKGQRVAVRVDHKLSERALGGQHWLEIVVTDRRVLNRPDVGRNLDAAFPDGQFRYFDAHQSCSCRNSFGIRAAYLQRTTRWHAQTTGMVRARIQRPARLDHSIPNRRLAARADGVDVVLELTGVSAHRQLLVGKTKPSVQLWRRSAFHERFFVGLTRDSAEHRAGFPSRKFGWPSEEHVSGSH